jgi:hypothetical protein
VYRDGRRESFAVTLEDTEPFAQSAAQSFGVGPGRLVSFDPKTAKELLKKASRVREES